MQLASSLLNALLSLDPDLAARLAPFEGRVIALEVRGTGLAPCLKIEAGRIVLDKRGACIADTTIKGSPAALFRMGLQQDVSDLMFKGDVEITGDTRLGRQFRKVLKEIEPDIEEPLSRIVGDVIAHRAVGMLTDIARWGRRARHHFVDDVSEYLQEESRDVISAAELEGFNAQVDALRDDTERLSARMDRLLHGSNRG
jgi:ubiquinone biosynthesis protein UbiJ